jgi:ATP-binding cassette subfamily B protein/subfamily B ATP-binding cassette protein MsbA
MTNFVRVIRLALRHRLTVVASISCSLIVALLWGGNITAIYPIVDVVMNDKSIPEWMDERVESIQTGIEELVVARDTWRQPPGDATLARHSEQKVALRDIQKQLDEKRKKLQYLLWAKPWVHRYMPMTPFHTLALVCLELLTGTMIKSIFRVAGYYCTARLGHLTAFELRKEFYRRTLRLDMGTFSQTGPGDLMNRFMSDVSVVSSGTQTVFGLAIREPLKMVVCLAGAAWVSWQLLLLTLILAPLAGYAIYWLAKALKRANRRALEELSTVYDRLGETFGGLKVIQAFTMESRERSRFHRTSKQYYNRSMKITLYNALVSPLTESMGISIVIAATLAGGYLVLNQKTHLFGLRISQEPLTHGMLTLYYGFLAGASDPVRRLSSVFNGLQKAAAASDHLYELLDRDSQVADPQVPAQLASRLGRIQFRDVSFAYRPEERVLDRVDLQILCGETIAVVGPNGCGKSTLVNLLARFYDPISGAVTFDGTDLRNVRVRDVRKRIGVVTQESILFDDSVMDNIRYGSPWATESQIRDASKQAYAHQFITKKLAHGYQTRVGTGGNRLSGGQRQRIALARAILRDPEILILDEATSQIDVESERLIRQVLEKFVQGRTVVMITHRPSTLALADRIVVMNHGRIVDVGSYDELAGRCDLFRRLAHLDQRESA